MVCGTYNYSFHGVYKPSFHHVLGAPHCIWIAQGAQTFTAESDHADGMRIPDVNDRLSGGLVNIYIYIYIVNNMVNGY